MNKHYNKIYFQGSKELVNKRYFEGWYFKQVNKDLNYTISFIPGVSYNDGDSHSFIQCIICNKDNELSSHYFRYELSEFSYSSSPFSVKIGKSSFCENKIDIDIEDSTISVIGKLEFEALEPLPHSFLRPNIMGFFSYIPKMECNHHIISMNHRINGKLLIDHETLDLTDGFGYMEKDWGKSFPTEYIWLQCNHFKQSDIRVTVSVATIPFGLFSFKGFFCSLFVGDKEYRFATYNRSKLILNSAKDGVVDICLIKGNLELNIVGVVDNTQVLASPKNGIMDHSIKEGLAGRVSISLKNSKTGLSIKSNGTNAGIEIMMDF